MSLGAITLGTLAAVAAAVFGGIAMDVAVQKGYSEALFEDHEGLAWTTVWFFGALTVVRLYAWRRAVNLSGVRGWGVVAAGLIGVGILVATAFHGGELVYGHGVNVAAVQPGNFDSDSERGGRSGPVFPLRYDTLPDSGSSAYRLGATAQPTCCRPAS